MQRVPAIDRVALLFSVDEDEAVTDDVACHDKSKEDEEIVESFGKKVNNDVALDAEFFEATGCYIKRDMSDVRQLDFSAK